jgi:hypothetical protein
MIDLEDCLRLRDFSIMINIRTYRTREDQNYCHGRRFFTEGHSPLGESNTENSGYPIVRLMASGWMKVVNEKKEYVICQVSITARTPDGAR